MGGWVVEIRIKAQLSSAKLVTGNELVKTPQHGRGRWVRKKVMEFPKYACKEFKQRGGAKLSQNIQVLKKRVLNVPTKLFSGFLLLSSNWTLLIVFQTPEDDII